MRRILAVAVLALAACGGSEPGGEGGSGGTGGAGGAGPVCYEYVLNPATGESATHCTDRTDEAFCWWTGRTVTDEPERECSAAGAEVGCFKPSRGYELYLCVVVACRYGFIDNDPCCEADEVQYFDDSIGPWDHLHEAFCL
jgi:hypothetical protein